MKNTSHSKLILISLLFLISLYGCREKKEPPRAVQGMLDLSKWDFKKDGSHTLNGEWEFYWQQLLTPKDFAGPSPPKKTGYSVVPDYWQGQVINGTALHYRGYATIRLFIRMPANPPPVSLEIASIWGASRVWLNGRLLSENGTMGTSRDEVQETISRYFIHHINISEPVQELIIQLANFDMYPDFSTFFSLNFGPQEDIQFNNYFRIGIDIFTMGASLIMGLYHLILFLFRTKNRSNLYFGIIFVLFGFWFLNRGASTGLWLHVLLPGSPWQVRFTGSQIMFYFSAIFFTMFIHYLYPRECSKTVVRITQLIFGFWSIAVIMLPLSSGVESLEKFLLVLFYPTVRPIELLFMILVLYLSGVIVLAAWRKRPGAYILVGGILLFLIIVIHDVVTHLHHPSYIRLQNLGGFVLLISQSFMLAKVFSQSFNEVELLSDTLKEKNIALSRLDKIKDEFLANTSHELRTPLNGIIGVSESLIHGVAGKLPEKAMENLTMIFASSKRLAGLVNDLLDFSRLKNREIELKKKPVDINSLTDAILSVTQNLAGHKPIAFEKSIPSDIPLVEGDENRLQQILYNLVGNAIKFTDKGKIIVGAAQRDKMVEIWVSDTGIGIPEDKFDTIFKAFEQVDAAPTREYGGTGLGLSITRQLVELHGGDIRVESAIGKGTTFAFTIPASQGGQDTIASSESERIETDQKENKESTTSVIKRYDTDLRYASDKESYQVLVVDDDPINLQVVANHLSLENISFSTAADGIEAIRLIESGNIPHIILLDIMMPKMTGYEVCQKLRNFYSPSELPIIMLTAKNHVADLVEGFKAGANDYLSKPFSKDELIARVTCHLDLKAAYDTFVENQRLKQEILEQTQKKERAQLEEEKAKLEKLRYQLNPHFLFNALASIRGAMSKENEAAHKMVSLLSEFSRMALSTGAMETLTIAQEVHIIRLYLEMEQMRMGDYLQISIDIEPEAEPLQVPALLLQPLVENAVKYGSQTSPDELEIEITIKIKSDKLGMRVSNTGTWMKPGTSEGKPSMGLGITNIKKRLEKYFPEAYTFETRTTHGRVIAEIVIPLNKGKYLI